MEENPITVVLVHGALADGRIWEPYAEIFPAGWNVVAPTLTGFGGSRGNFGLNSHADELKNLLKQLDKGRCIIVGWSYGADVVLNFLAKNPETELDIILYEPGLPFALESSALEDWFDEAQQVFEPLVELVAEHDSAAAAISLVESTSGEKGYFPKLSKSLQDIYLDNAYSLENQLNQTEPGEVSASALGKTSSRVTFICGEKSLRMFKVVCTANPAVNKNFSVLELPGATHMLPVDDPDRFAGIIIQVLDNLAIE